MHEYTQILKDQLSRNMPYYGEQDVNTVLEMLYSVYRGKQNTDPEEIERGFSQLDTILRKLTVKECDRVWDFTCGLCSAVEKLAFLEGIRVGAALAVELKDFA